MAEQKRSVVRVQLFSVLRERMQSSSVDIALDGPVAADALLNALCARYPQIARYRSMMILAVNHTYARPGDPVRPGDELAVITPVSGG